MIINVTEHEYYTEWEDSILNQNQPAVIIFTADILKIGNNKYVNEIEKALERNCIRGLLFESGLDINVIDDLQIDSLPRVVIFKEGKVIKNLDPWSDLDEIIETIDNMYGGKESTPLNIEHALIIDGKPTKELEEELKTHFLAKAETEYVDLLNFSGTVGGADKVEAELQKIISDIKNRGKKIVKVIGYIMYCDESDLDK